MNCTNSDNAVSNERDVRIFLQQSASRPDGLDSPFVNIAAFKMRNSSISMWVLAIILFGVVH